MLKNKLDQYFANEFIKNFLLILISLSLLMLLTQAARFLNIITEMGNSTIIYVKFVVLSYPRILEKTVQLTFIISIFFTISKLRNDNELNIYWFSGISQLRIFKLIFKITVLIFIFYYFLSIFLGPLFSNYARKIISNSEFTLINSLVKENNFNSPLKKLVIYVDKNDKKGNLKNIFIHEKDRIISADNGFIIKKNNEFFLELNNGVSQEKNNNNINFIQFEKLLFGVSKFQTKNLKEPKFSERNIFWLINGIKLKKMTPSRMEDARLEINKRLIQPLGIFLLAIISSYILYLKDGDSKFKLSNNFIFACAISWLIINEILLSLSSKSTLNSFIYFLIIFLLSLFLSLKFFFTQKNEN